ncbi:hypothetical protein IWX85_003612 [Polaromonas sp. CG_9.11]|nr:hypothetical protein [Polaromonas sp. CG_9.11]
MSQWLAAKKSSIALDWSSRGEKRPGLFFVGRITAQRRQRIRGKRHEAVQRQTPRNVFDVRVQAQVFVDHQHRRQSGRARTGRSCQVTLDAAIAGGRWNTRALGLEPRIVLRNLLSRCKVGAQRRQQADGGDPRRGKLLRLHQKTAPVQGAVDIGIKQNQQFLFKVLRGQAWRHGAFLG